MKVALVASVVINLFLAGFGAWAMLHADTLHRQLSSERRELADEIRVELAEQHEQALSEERDRLTAQHDAVVSSLRQELAELRARPASTPTAPAPQPADERRAAPEPTDTSVAWARPQGADADLWEMGLQGYEPLLHTYDGITGDRRLLAHIVFYQAAADGSGADYPRVMTVSCIMSDDTWKPAIEFVVITESRRYFPDPTLTIRLDQSTRERIDASWGVDFLSAWIGVDMLRRIAGANLVEVDWQGGDSGRLHPRSQQDLQTLLRAAAQRTAADAASIIPVTDG